jgi:hypothetical protein
VLAVLVAQLQAKLPQMVQILFFLLLPQQVAVKVQPDLQPLVMAEVAAVVVVLTTPAQELELLDKDMVVVRALAMVQVLQAVVVAGLVLLERRLQLRHWLEVAVQEYAHL